MSEHPIARIAVFHWDGDEKMLGYHDFTISIKDFSADIVRKSRMGGEVRFVPKKKGFCSCLRPLPLVANGRLQGQACQHSLDTTTEKMPLQIRN